MFLSPPFYSNYNAPFISLGLIAGTNWNENCEQKSSRSSIVTGVLLSASCSSLNAEYTKSLSTCNRNDLGLLSVVKTLWVFQPFNRRHFSRHYHRNGRCMKSHYCFRCSWSQLEKYRVYFTELQLPNTESMPFDFLQRMPVLSQHQSMPADISSVWVRHFKRWHRELQVSLFYTFFLCDIRNLSLSFCHDQLDLLRDLSAVLYT